MNQLGIFAVLLFFHLTAAATACDKILDNRIQYVILNLSSPENRQHFDEIQTEIVQKLPQDIKLIFFGGDDLVGKYGLHRSALYTPREQNYGAWARDDFPLFIKKADGKSYLLSFANRNSFYDTVTYDAPVIGTHQYDKALAAAFNLNLVRSEFVVAGGSFIRASDEYVFVSEAVAGLQEDNTYKSREEIEVELKKRLEVKNVVWLKPLPEENTTHLDLFMNYAGNNHFFVAEHVEAKSLRAKVLNDTANLLLKLGFKVDRIKIKTIKFSDLKEDLFVSTVSPYLNSLIVNNTVLMSVLDSRRLTFLDKEAIAVYKKAGFTVIPITSKAALKLAGATHCVTMEVPGGLSFDYQKLIDSLPHRYTKRLE